MTLLRSVDDSVGHRDVDGPVSARELIDRFPPRERGSVRSLLTQMGPFVAERDAFRFENSFGLTPENSRRMRERVTGGIVEQATFGLSKPYRSTLEALRFDNPIPFLPDLSLPGSLIDDVVGRIGRAIEGAIIDDVASVIPTTYGRCGGMAFAGFDFYLAAWIVDERLGTRPPDGGPVGDYIFDRLLDSLSANVLTFLDWWGRVHVWPKVRGLANASLRAAMAASSGGLSEALKLLGADFSPFDFGGPREIRDQSRRELSDIEATLGRQAAVPVGLIYGDTANLWSQHQVLAIGCQQISSDNLRLDIWDNNDANAATVMDIDLSGSELEVDWQAPPPIDKHEVKGIFQEEYRSKLPPASLHLD